jgi:hypothetical protein
MEAIEILLKQFETFVKRSLLPSSSFLMFFLLFDIFFNGQKFIGFLDREHSIVMLVIMIIIFIGFSNFLTILHQSIYDNNIKGNYDGRVFFSKENMQLVILRERVIKTLENSGYSDYLLYQIIGKKMRGLNKSINTKRYIDDVKSIGIVFVSLLIVIFIAVVNFLVSANLLSIMSLITLLLTPFVMVGIYLIGEELIKSKYRSRAIRIYTNYLDEVD